MTPHPVAMLDLTRRDPEEVQALTAAFQRVLASGRFILGPEVDAFERQCADYLGAAHAIGVSSGTDALLVSLMALGLGASDEILCPAYSFIATAEAIVRAGATPVFVDIEPQTYGLDADEAARALTPRTRAVVVAHLFGRSAALDRICAFASAHELAVIEDAAQAFGATHDGRKVGTFGTLGCYSFFPSKNLGGFGDGGMVVTDDAELALRVRRLRQHGASAKHRYDTIGGNFRLDALQAALLQVRLKRLDHELMRRRAIAQRYDASMRESPLVIPPVAHSEATYNQYVVRVREGHAPRFREHLAARGIASDTYYPLALTEQPCLARYASSSMPVAEALARESVAIPIGPTMTDPEILAVTAALRDFA
jgi:dTDP-4-amino-4,6-dideoxygalactose transaminase